jgi:hypothetical protein
LGGGGEERGGEALVELEEVLDSGLVVGEGLGAVEAVDGAVECLVGLEEIGGHVERVVEAGIGEARAGVEDGLGEEFDHNIALPTLETHRSRCCLSWCSQKRMVCMPRFFRRRPTFL